MTVVCFKQKTAYEMRISDWSSDVCSSDLLAIAEGAGVVLEEQGLTRLGRDLRTERDPRGKLGAEEGGAVRHPRLQRARRAGVEVTAVGGMDDPQPLDTRGRQEALRVGEHDLEAGHGIVRHLALLFLQVDEQQRGRRRLDGEGRAHFQPVNSSSAATGISRSEE